MGYPLGKVMDLDDESVVVARGPVGGHSTRVPIKLIANEDPDEKKAVLTVAAGEPEHRKANCRPIQLTESATGAGDDRLWWSAY